MTRIIGGTAGGRRLETPRGDATRPTSDRVKEALFSAVEAALGTWAGLRVLDLYAGSGAIGLEALSRGAAAATLVEQDRRTAALISANARAIGLGQATVVTSSVARFLTGQPEAPFDVVFLDPPYAVPGVEVSEALAVLADRWLAEDALVVVERSKREVGLTWPPALAHTRERRYGETTLVFGSAVSLR